MKILVTNDDGIHSGALWTLAGELKKVAEVVVVAPDGERSAIGTAVTLLKPLHAVDIEPPVAGVKAYAIDGSPSDCVILALGKLIEGKVDMVVSGINPNYNVGEDVHLSGTVGAALQGYFRGLPAMAISTLAGSVFGFDTAAKVAAILAEKMAAHMPLKIFLNVNVPDLPLEKIVGVKITRLARSSHISTVEEEHQGGQKHYLLVRSRLATAKLEGTDIEAVDHGYVSMTALYTSFLDKPPQRIMHRLCNELQHEIIKSKKGKV